MTENIGTIDEQPVGFDFEKLYSIDEATGVFHVSKSQISRDSNSNPKRLAYLLNDRGKRRYKAADLYQLYGFRKQDERDKKERSELKNYDGEPNNLIVELAVLKEQLRSKDEALQVKNEALRRSEDEINDLRRTRDRLIEQNNRLTLLLPAPQTANFQSVSPYEPPEPKKSWWQRLFS